jgi:hypothetical protein
MKIQKSENKHRTSSKGLKLSVKSKIKLKYDTHKYEFTEFKLFIDYRIR